MKKFIPIAFLVSVCHNTFAQNVGIGNNNPQYKLDVSGDVNLTGRLRLNGAATANKVLKTDANGNPIWEDDNNSGGTVTSIATNNGITGGTITNSGTIGLTGQALALHNLATNGLITRTASGTVATRTITAGAGISIINADGVSGNPTIASTITQYTDAAARQAISLTTTNNSGAATYSNITGVLNVPNYSLAGLGGVPTARTITMNGTINQITVSPTGAQNLSADRTWTFSLPQNIHTDAIPTFGSGMYNTNNTTSTNISPFIRMTNTTTGSASTDGLVVGVDGSGDAWITNKENKSIKFGTNDINRMEISSNGHLLPNATNTYDLGSNGNRFKDAYLAGRLYGSGSASLYGAISIDGVKNSYSGINFRSGTTNYGTFMVRTTGTPIQGFYNAADNGWLWYWDNGVLTAGTVPWARLSNVPTTFTPSAHTHSAADITSGTLPLARGGTGATDAAGARTSLGLGTMATQNADAVAITGGTVFASGNSGVGTASAFNANVRFSIDGGLLQHRVNSQNYPFYDAAGGWAAGWNFSGGSAEVDFWNVWNTNPAAARGFTFRQQTGASTGTLIMRINGSGALSAASYTNFSDKRLKTNIKQLGINDLEKINSINIYSYNFNKTASAEYEIGLDNKLHYGVIAQELELIFPELITEEPNGIKTVNYVELVPILIEYTKSLSNRVQQLEKYITEKK